VAQDGSLNASVLLTRADLVRYAVATGDPNPIHWDEGFTVAARPPGVIAHEMLTMRLAGRVITAWAAGLPFRLVDAVERATGIEPAWPAWKTVPMRRQDVRPAASGK
jgi:acyl dehydratase